MQPRRYVQQLKGTAGDTITVDPAASQPVATFKFENIEPKQGSGWCYAEKIRLYISIDVNQAGGAGVVIPPDQLYRCLASVKLTGSDFGQLYGPGDINGPALGLIAQVVSNRYALPFPLRDNIAAANGDTVATIPIDIPLAHRCFFKGHQTGIWNGFLRRDALLDVTLAAGTVLAAFSPGASFKTPCTVRAELVYTVEPEARPPVFWHWRTRSTPASETKHVIKNLCQGNGITGVTGKGKIAFLAWLSNLAGLGGATSVDQITRVYPRDRGQGSHNLGTPFFGPSSFLYDFVEETRPMGIFGTGQGFAYPYQFGTQVNGSPNAATALFLPYFWPEVQGQQASKLQEWSGDYYIEHDYAAVPAALGQWLSLEQSYLTQQQEEFLMGERMGLPSSVFKAFPKVDRPLHQVENAAAAAQQQQKLRGIPKKARPVRAT